MVDPGRTALLIPPAVIPTVLGQGSWSTAASTAPRRSCSSPTARPPSDVATTYSPLLAPDKEAPFVTRSCSSARIGAAVTPAVDGSTEGN